MDHMRKKLAPSLSLKFCLFIGMKIVVNLTGFFFSNVERSPLVHRDLPSGRRVICWRDKQNVPFSCRKGLQETYVKHFLKLLFKINLIPARHTHIHDVQNVPRACVSFYFQRVLNLGLESKVSGNHTLFCGLLIY